MPGKFINKPLKSLSNFSQHGKKSSSSSQRRNNDENDASYTSPASITPPQNSPPKKKTRYIDPDINDLTPAGKTSSRTGSGKLRKKKTSGLGKSFGGIVNTLNTNADAHKKHGEVQHNGKIIKRVSKKNLYIHNDESGDLIPVGNKSAMEGLSQDIHGGNNDLDGMMALFDVNDVVERSLNLSKEVEDAKEKRKVRLAELERAKTLAKNAAAVVSIDSDSSDERETDSNSGISWRSRTRTRSRSYSNDDTDAKLEAIMSSNIRDEKDSEKSREIESFQRKVQEEQVRKKHKIANGLPGDVDNDGTLSLLNDEDKINRIRPKFETSKPYINCELIKSKEDVASIVMKYRKTIENILEGRIGSYFYNEAKKVSNASKLMHVRDSELDNLPKHKYYGYIGAVRGFHIGKRIVEDEKLGPLLKQKAKFSKVMKFWGIDQFAQYVLVPEVIAQIVLENGKLSDLDAAYDEMEATSEYGTFVANAHPLETSDETPTGHAAPITVDVDLDPSLSLSLSEPEAESGSGSESGSDFDFLK